MKTLSESAIHKELEQLIDWTFTKNALEKNFLFKDFTSALGFIVQVGIIAEKGNHHPELFNVYNKVTLRLATHDANGVTQKDVDLAKAIDALP